MSQPINRSVIRYEGSQAERLALGPQSAEFKKIIEWVEPGGNVFEQRLDGSWTQTSFGGAVNVTSTFSPSQDYIHDLAMAATAQVVTLDSDTTALEIFNQGATTETIRYAFGTSSADAAANLTITSGAATTGIKVPTYADFGALCKVNVGRPVLATHVAFAPNAALDVNAVQVTQGVVK